jgi:hypothetical protein
MYYWRPIGDSHCPRLASRVFSVLKLQRPRNAGGFVSTKLPTRTLTILFGKAMQHHSCHVVFWFIAPSGRCFQKAGPCSLSSVGISRLFSPETPKTEECWWFCPRPGLLEATAGDRLDASNTIHKEAVLSPCSNADTYQHTTCCTESMKSFQS